MKIDEMLKVPGMYVCSGVFGRQIQTFVVEVTDDKCYQCKLEAPFARDGTLTDEGWNREANIDCVGPFGKL